MWLTPHSLWRKRYADWPALKKLEYVDDVMGQVAGKAPLVTTTGPVEPIRRIRRTLRQHYKRKRKHYGLEHPYFYDRDLRRLFSDAAEHAKNIPADRFVKWVRRDVRRLVARWTATYQYTRSTRCSRTSSRGAASSTSTSVDRKNAPRKISRCS